ncbi:sushi, von Willebrand factor type A, EGF and pentraxin domain-containing protein 1-like [Cyprinus carpio]|uniref:Sushi, von Willebrand factor type A, EGF and pentraxin domain-containing protein 1-like n=1 Tax=Cyprinus carpio TaxID=7962 RepID=A0A9Q9VNR1_CYPCA|nr:sushi, von Willebrand factor type A, EGF and pentraxin domain-containing protein 1-like [Cyprinus carpio]
MNTAFGKQLKMKYCKIFLFLLLMIMGVSTNAQEVTCEGEQLINVDIVVGNPGKAPPYKPGHILVFRCTDVKLKMHGQQVIECLSNGKWDYPYPKCGDVTCLLNTKKENIKMDRFPDFECPVTPGYNLTFSCNGQGLILKGQEKITCQSNGEWSSPFPKCEDKHTEAVTCELKSTTFGVIKIKPHEPTFSELEKVWRSPALKNTGSLVQKKTADHLHAKIMESGTMSLFVQRLHVKFHITSMSPRPVWIS